MIRKAFVIVLLALLALGAPAALADPPGPYLTTGAADQITENSARVVVYVNGNAQATDIPTKCWIDYDWAWTYGPGYGSRVDIPCAGTVYQTLTPLASGTTYHYQLGACNADGLGYSPTYKSFTTLGPAYPKALPANQHENPCSSPPGGTPSPPPPAGQASLTVSKKQHIRTVAKKGVRLRLTLPPTCPCAVSAQLRVSKQTAKRLHLSSRRLGSVERKGLLGEATVTVRLKSSAVKRLRRSRRAVTVEAAARVTDAQGHTSALSRKLKLRR